MTTREVFGMVNSMGFPAAYYQFTGATAKAPPFICFYYPGINDFLADDTNYAGINELIIELYTDNKDFEAEAAVEDILHKSGIVYGKAEAYIESEKMYMITYNMEVLIDE